MGPQWPSEVLCRFELVLCQVIFLVEFVDATADDLDGLLGFGGVGVGGYIAERLHHIEATDDLAEHDVLAVQPASLGQQDVELGAVGVWSVIGHGNPAGTTMGQGKVLIVELVTKDAAACKNEGHLGESRDYLLAQHTGPSERVCFSLKCYFVTSLMFHSMSIITENEVGSSEILVTMSSHKDQVMFWSREAACHYFN